jgi:hypothetical protein
MAILMDEEKLFKLNPKMEYSVKTVDTGSRSELKIVTVHDFYENPEAVRAVFLNAPHTRCPTSTGASPWWRANFIADLRHVYSKVISLVDEHIEPGVKINLKNSKQLQSLASRAIDNYIDGCPYEHLRKFLEWHRIKYNRKDPWFHWRTYDIPHVDATNYAATVWLNDNEKCQGGTGFYQHIETGVASMQDIQAELLDKDEVYQKEFFKKINKRSKDAGKFLQLSGTNDVARLYHVEEMKFNTATIYSGNFFHNAYLKEGYFKDSYRLSQMLWFPAKENKRLLPISQIAHKLVNQKPPSWNCFRNKNISLDDYDRILGNSQD